MTRTALLDSPDVPATTAAETAGVDGLLAGLAAWQESWHRHCAARLGVQVTAVEVVAEVGSGHEVRFDVRLRGPEPAERYAAVLAAARDHAPVLDLVTGGGAAPAGH
ncbi:hypothetical protein [Nocardioides aurantiacus]|uniref:hypothetical protein n=1 Tax=Nocardioides aurantiacus TaxID=86796 RepID=UPI00403F2A83